MLHLGILGLDRYNLPETKNQKFQNYTMKLSFSCNQCDYKAKGKGDILKHMKSKHEGLMGSFFSCDQCDYKTTDKAHLWQHLKSKHP